MPGALAWPAVRAFLQQRRGLLDGVVFSGGEPTLQTALVPALAEARALGFATGLHTAGMYPERLAQALPHLDWVGLDVKVLAAQSVRHWVLQTCSGQGRPQDDNLSASDLAALASRFERFEGR